MKKLLILLIPMLSIGITINSRAQLKVLQSIPVDSVVSDFPVSFAFVGKNNWQFVAYYNKDRNLTVAGKRESETKWTYKILPTKVGWDSHNSIVMTLDRENCLHLSGNMHADSMIYFKANKPFDISSLEKIFPLIKSEDELSCTYPSFTKNIENKLIYTYRKGGSGNGNTINITYDENTKTFSRLSNKFLFDGMNQMSAYSTTPKLGKDGYFHIAWVWRDTPDSETNHDLSYARSKDLITWENMAGEIVDLPISPLNKQFIVDPVPAGGGIINGGFEMFFDNNYKPHFVFHKYDSNGFTQLFIAKSDGKTWNIQQVSDWNHRWDFKGPGSLTSEFKIQSSSMSNNDMVEVKYWHLKRGSGVISIDFNNLKPISDVTSKTVETSLYPAELLEPNSGMEGSLVHWLKANEQNDHFYAFRWETLGRRRFYEKVETPVKPVLMNMYKISKK